MKHITRTLATALLVLMSVGLQAQTEEDHLEYSGNWMGRISDDTFVAALSIPGTHDSSTGGGWMENYKELGDLFARTQELTFAQQWSIGIRAFDMRPCVYEDHLNLNHGVCPTVLHLENVLLQMRDSLIANPTEFIFIHLNHESEGDVVDDPGHAIYNERILQLLTSDELKDYLVDFKRTLRLSEVRGKFLVVSRDKYAAEPVGGFFSGWTGSADWTRRTQAKVTGPGTASDRVSSIYIQDYWQTYEEGAMDTKLRALTELLQYGSTHQNRTASAIVWYLNFASAYSKVGIFNSALSEGYRENASFTNKAVVDYLADESHAAGPTGIILMDYVGVDETEGYATMGASAVRSIISHNFRYLEDLGETSVGSPESQTRKFLVGVYSLMGTRLPAPPSGSISILRYSDGSSRVVKF